ncbi:MAG: ribosomal protein S12 methylthiotransferase RimO [Ignavibacteria bacterium RIFCSPLOWO2_02_FULL_55_14]|nr:MAG: ribosomal protein S12 methylthiotransferase RimO [Ignavibacteria bacterium RIFCSPLOWO2_12_FULL_56_21]OGU73740.1 MAG: ribosomal protein S12 methylthiotransferase RimO [Ignavibacteria bacterium RIFCSPLOWO2_02_FULL_55_14]
MAEKDKPKIHVVTLGCSKNLVDSEALMGQLRVNNAPMTGNVDDADTVVINTCGFIEAAKQESIDAILEAVGRKNRGEIGKVVVMGCLSERFRNELRAEIPEVDSYFGSNEMPKVLADLGVDYKRDLLGERLLTTPAHFAYVKISEGCDNPCSFCAIPLMRGGHRTRPMEEVLNEARGLARKGVRELIIIGQDTTYYGLDTYGERRLHDLLGGLNAIDGIEWIRLMYAYPAKFPTDLIDAFHEYPKLCRYIDIPVQHASDRVLRSMRRGITQRGLRELLLTLKERISNVALRTTLIVGYPEETDEDFRVLTEFVKEMRFHRLGVFTYSQEEGTTAYGLGDPVPLSVKEERQAEIMEIQQSISQERNEALLGTNVRMMVDRHEGEFSIGRTEWDAPEIDQEVFVRHRTPLQQGNFYDVRITETTEYDLYGDVVGS